MANIASPKKFRVWFRHGDADEQALRIAVRAWSAHQKSKGLEIAEDPRSTTAFEIEENIMPGIGPEDFASGLKTMLEMEGDDPQKLFHQGNVALYPEW